MSRASWSKLGGGRLRRPELELAPELCAGDKGFLDEIWLFCRVCWPETSRRPRLSFAVRTKMSVALHVKKHGGSHSRSTG